MVNPLENHMRTEMQSALKMTYSPFLNRAGLTAKKQILDRMADDFRVIVTNCGAVVENDLELLGWSPTQIASHGKEAARLAMARAADR